MPIHKLIKNTINDDLKLSLMIYATPEEIVEAFYGPLDQIESIGGFDGDGVNYTLSVEDMLTSVRKMGCWGFCDNKTCIHVWFAADVDIKDLIRLLAHERGHSLRPFLRDSAAEERKAGKYEEAAVFAFEIAQELIKSKSL